MAVQWFCVDCGVSVNRRVKRCPPCNTAFLPTRPGYEHTPEIRAARSAALKGKSHSYRSGSTRPEVAAKIRQAWQNPALREAARQRGLRQADSQAWRDLIARSVAGELNPNFQGKDHATGYGPGWGRLHKRLIRERAGYRCETCGVQKTLDIHHKDWSKTNHHPDNLAALCRSCHKRDHYPRNSVQDSGT